MITTHKLSQTTIAVLKVYLKNESMKRNEFAVSCIFKSSASL